MEQSYLSWLAGETAFSWNNDSALQAQIEAALTQGAIGITTNPPLSYEALISEPDIYGEKLADLDKSLPDLEYARRAMCLVVKRFSGFFMELHEKKGGFYGCVRAQVAPSLRHDAVGMLEMGRRLSQIGKNVMVKIPGTKAGMWALEELAALGIPTNPTVITTVAQAVEAAKAHERGRDRAAKAGISPAWSSCAVVMGRAQDYFAKLNGERKLGLAKADLDWASLAIVKRSAAIYKKEGFNSKIMPAAFRAPMQVEQLAGGEYHATIHPAVQAAVEEAYRAGQIKREILFEAPVDEGAVRRVAEALPEFGQAYEPDGLSIDEFDSCGSVVMTLDAFEATGWAKLASLRRG